MTPRRKLATVSALAVMAVGTAFVPATYAGRAEDGGRAVGDLCGFEYAPALSETERARVTRSATRAITVWVRRTGAASAGRSRWVRCSMR